MSDLIKREDVRREIQASFDGGAFRWQDGQDLMDRISALPAVSPWHRVEERLPEPNVQCLVIDNKGRCAVGYYRYDAQAWDSPAFGWIEREYRLIEYGDEDFYIGVGPIVAWMPLPEPPQEVQE